MLERTAKVGEWDCDGMGVGKSARVPGSNYMVLRLSRAYELDFNTPNTKIQDLQTFSSATVTVLRQYEGPAATRSKSPSVIARCGRGTS